MSSAGAAPGDNPWARPPAALVKAMIIHCANSVGGKTNVNTFFPDPACDPEELEVAQDSLGAPDRFEAASIAGDVRLRSGRILAEDHLVRLQLALRASHAFATCAACTLCGAWLCLDASIVSGNLVEYVPYVYTD